MQLAVLGTGMVGTAIATKLVELGHDVALGSRTTDNSKAAVWLAGVDASHARVATFADAAAGAELLFNCTSGMASLDALALAGADNMRDKILVDVANPLDFSHGMPPRLSICNDSSLGEQIQAAFPATRVVKSLNTVNANLMVNPSALAGEHLMFMAGNDAEAKRTVEHTILRGWFGWQRVLDLGDITAARGTEMYLPLWLRMYGALNTASFNITIVGAG